MNYPSSVAFAKLFKVPKHCICGEELPKRYKNYCSTICAKSFRFKRLVKIIKDVKIVFNNGVKIKVRRGYEIKINDSIASDLRELFNCPAGYSYSRDTGNNYRLGGRN